MRKKAKELRKKGGRVKPPKDPGIPAAWPFKEQLLQEMEFEKHRRETAVAARKEAAKARRVRAGGGQCRAAGASLRCSRCPAAAPRPGCALSAACRPQLGARRAAGAPGGSNPAGGFGALSPLAQAERRAAPDDDDAMGDQEEEPDAVGDLAARAAAEGDAFDGAARPPRAAGGPEADADRSRRAFYREFVKVVDASDVVIQAGALARCPPRVPEALPRC